MVMGTGSPGRVWKAEPDAGPIGAGYRCHLRQPRDRPVVGVCRGLHDQRHGRRYRRPHRAPGHRVGTCRRDVTGRASPRSWRSRARTSCARRRCWAPTAAHTARRSLPVPVSGRSMTRASSCPSTMPQRSPHMNLSPHTLADDRAARDWLDIIEFSPQRVTPGVRGAVGPARGEIDRLAAYRGITRPALVVGFEDDRTLPAFLAREVAEAIPGGALRGRREGGPFRLPGAARTGQRIVVEFLGQH